MSVPQWLNGAYSSAGPSFSFVGNKLVAVWKGAGNDNRIWCSTASFTNWEGWSEAQWSNPAPLAGANFATTLAPCLTDPITYPDGSSGVSLFWRSASDKSIWNAAYDGANWSEASQVPGAISDAAPAATYYKGNLIAAWRGEGSDQQVHWSVLPGASSAPIKPLPKWGPPSVVPGVGGTSDAPALAAAASGVYLVWKGESSDPRIFYSTYDGNTWTAQQLVPGVGGTSQGPVARAAAVGPTLTDNIWLAWKGEGNDERVFYSGFDATSKQWAPQQALPVAATNGRPALVSYDASIYSAWTDAAGSAIFWGALLQISAPAAPPPVATATFQPPAWSTSDGNTIGGRVTLTVRSDGTWTVDFDTWNGPGVPTYNFQIRSYLIGPNVPVLLLSHSDSIGNNVQNRVDKPYTESGMNPMIILHWDAINSPTTQFQVKVDFQLSGVLGFIEAVVTDLLDLGVGAVGAAIGAVIAVTREAIGSLNLNLGPGATIGVIAGAAVFVIGAFAGAPLGSAAVLGTVAGVATGAVANALIQSRAMIPNEIMMAQEVFGSELNCANVMFTNFNDSSGRAMTAPGVDGRTYCNFGPLYAADMTAQYNGAYPDPGELMIHELTHAWQIQHNSFIPGFVCSGFVNQANYTFGDNVYRYGPPGPPWQSYNLEQQASIVNEWFAGKLDPPTSDFPAPQSSFNRMDPNNPYIMYIKNNILTGSAGYSNSLLDDQAAEASA
jgi:hypothetical protein